MTTNSATAFFLLLLAGVGRCQSTSDIPTEDSSTSDIIPTTESFPVTDSDAPAQPERECTKAGLMCATCGVLAMCVGAGDGTFIKITQHVRNGEKCIAGTPVEGALCNYSPDYSCTGMGYFPDPYDCQKYHMCLPEDESYIDLPFVCEEGKSYIASSEDCSGTLKSPACIDTPVPECKNRTQIGTLTGDANLYYYCIEEDGLLFPEIYKCSGGKHFDVNKKSCA